MANSALRLLKITDTSYIFPLRQFGPIPTPTYITESVAYNMVQRGYSVIEVDPLDRSRQVKLTTSNFYQKDRFAPKSSAPKVDNTALTGKDLTGVATKVNTIPKNRVVEEDLESMNNATTNDNVNLRDNTAIPSSPLSRAERKRLAKEKRKEAAAAAAAVADSADSEVENEAVEETIPATENTTTTE